MVSNINHRYLYITYLKQLWNILKVTSRLHQIQYLYISFNDNNIIIYRMSIYILGWIEI